MCERVPSLSTESSLHKAAEIQTRHTISVIIPTYQGEQWLQALLQMLALQTILPDELLIIDSNSSDKTRAIAKEFQATVVKIQTSSFDHGGTRTMAARMAKGDLLVYMTQDAIPEDIHALERLVTPLLEKSSLAATFGRQLPNKDASPLSEHLRLFNYPAKGYVRCWQDRQKYGFKTIFISNSFAAYRKSCLAEVNYFPENIIFGEDTCTLAKLLQCGYGVEYVSDSRVFHSHNYTFVQDGKRYFDIGVLHTLEQALVAQFGTPTGAGKRFVLSEIAFLFKRKKYILISQSLLRNILKYFAYGLGRRYSVLPRSLVRTLSMHHRWWK